MKVAWGVQDRGARKIFGSCLGAGREDGACSGADLKVCWRRDRGPSRLGSSSYPAFLQPRDLGPALPPIWWLPHP